MKNSITDFAAFGGKPKFAQCPGPARYKSVDWEKAEAELRGIFERHYFANHGPLANTLNEKFSLHCCQRYAVSVANDGLALMILAKGLGLTGEVIVPAICRPGVFEALQWAGLVPVPCDVEIETGLISVEKAEDRITASTSAIMGTHNWGRVCKVDELGKLSVQNNLKLFFDATHRLATGHDNVLKDHSNHTCYYSLSQGAAMSCGEGACIVTDDELLANKLRTIKNFHPSHTYCAVPLRLNGKMSEAQAAMALVELDNLELTIADRQRRFQKYAELLGSIAGISIFSDESSPNLVIQVDPLRFGVDRDTLLQVLAKENLYLDEPVTSLVSRGSLLPNAASLAKSLVQLPSHSGMSDANIVEVCELLRNVAESSAEITRRLGMVL